MNTNDRLLRANNVFYMSNIENQIICDVNLSVVCWVKWKFMFSQHAKAKVLAASFNSIFASLSIPGAKKLLLSATTWSYHQEHIISSGWHFSSACLKFGQQGICRYMQHEPPPEL
jgi:hypothetical protein